MKIEESLIKQIAALAAIEMAPEEMENQRCDLERIAVFTEKLSVLETEGLPEQTHPFGSGSDFSNADVSNHLREDIVTNENHSTEFVSAAPDSKGLYFRTPRTVEE